MANKAVEDDMWDVYIKAKHGYLDINVREIWQYRDLLRMFIVRDLVSVYKQTILGPLWFLLQPIFTALIYVFIFGRVAKLSTDGVPKILFYLGSVTLWNYFADTFRMISRTFSENASVMGKVYFPRLILPLSKVVSGMVKLTIQFSLFFVIWLYYYFSEHAISPNWQMMYFPFLLLVLAVFSFGSGILVSSLTVKYRDLNFIIAFGIQLLMYATPVIYPISMASPEMQFWLWLNPLTSLLEAFKYGFLGQGLLNYFWLTYSVVFAVVLALIGVITFNRVEKKFVDMI